MATLRFAVRSVAIIGAGPGGLAAAKYMRDQGVFSRIVVYEQNAEVGGAWNYSAVPNSVEHVPQENALQRPDEPIQPEPREDDPSPAPVYPTAIYSFLHTNVPHPLMGFSDLSFASVFGSDSDSERPEGGVLTIFPQRQDVFRYLLRYAADVRSLVRFSTVVDDVRLVPGASQQSGGSVVDRWQVHTTSTTGKTSTVETFDAVIVANGHYDITYLPDVPGIRAFQAAHPGVVTHAKRYRSPAPYTNKKVVVVGNAASGLDVSLQVSAVCRRPLLLSVHTPTDPDNLARLADVEEVPTIAEFLVAERGVRLADGRIVRDVDAVIYCTGYLFSLPFLEREGEEEMEQKKEEEKQEHNRLHPLLTNGRRVFGLYRDLLHIEHPTLAFLALPYRVIPFPLAESQAALLARVWANALSLPSREDMHAWERAAEQERPTSFHTWPLGDDGVFINETHRQIMEDGGAVARVGKEPPHWTDRQLWMRSLALAPKGRFEDLGRTATTLEELGYVFDGDMAQS
ncbi:flavin dependent oxidoreductase [Grosmannia clavigera kw1407]|uniref:Flavin dependent oxidoreductase n=1 Tax=Grosmannia clavigera (strain kw1407 / UAMH 11150) TaxID=655863 RepID=F0XLY1_GROCL|nr:flavin dependent oxidoreductase [Grosmannia clavigera kw1407]EFX01406.1 flavin dependent oxidoreductase [Grosmannia clavigera kw1407]